MTAPQAPRRITLFSTDIPFPANRGGRADIWRRVQAMARLGIKVQLISFYDDVPGKRPEQQHLDTITACTTDLKLFPVRQGTAAMLSALRKLPSKPWHVARRSLAAEDMHQLCQAVAGFQPDWLWCEGPWCGAIAKAAQQGVQAPMAYRSHNLEHIYMARQAAAARRPRDRLAWTLACLGLERFERQMLRSAQWVFDISCDDMAFWQTQGIQHISWLAPIAEAALVLDYGVAPQAGSVQHDVLFLGNLSTPNNVRGVEWLLNEIRPLVLAQRPATQFVVAGSNPGDHVRSLCAAPNVTLLPNVADALALYRQARVLVNPVRTGSGTHIKAIEMLMMRAPIVTATQGTQGMPAEVKRLFRVADTAEAFAQQVLDALAQPTDCWQERALARRLFGVQGLADALASLPASHAGHRLKPADAV
ncbi:MAG: glycosyltransferase family 4 protein [Burkholderiaceae bacterium]|nr:glycosyltransferase family 4 protein [Burkholderiaceae bacterium]